MSELPLEYCPYCKKVVPIHKAPRRGICCTFFIISYISPLLLMMLMWYIPLVILLSVFLPLIAGGIVLLWILYLRKVRPTVCNLCGTHTSVIEKKCQNCGAPLESQDKFCKECGNQLT